MHLRSGDNDGNLPLGAHTWRCVEVDQIAGRLAVIKQFDVNII